MKKHAFRRTMITIILLFAIVFPGVQPAFIGAAPPPLATLKPVSDNPASLETQSYESYRFRNSKLDHEELDLVPAPEPTGLPRPELDFFDDASFQWATNSNILLYRQLNSASTGPGGSPYDLWLFSAETNNTQLLAEGGNLWRFEFANDDQTVQFWQDGVPYQVYISEGSTAHHISTLKPIAKGDFSPDGSKLMYVTPDGELRFQLIHSGEERSIGTLPSLVQPTTIWPEWSPDGQFVAFLSDGEVQILGTGASSVEQLDSLGATAEPQGETSPNFCYIRWSTNSTVLFTYNGDVFPLGASIGSQPEALQWSSKDGRFFVSIKGGELFIQDSDTGDSRQLTRNQEVIVQQQKSSTEPQHMTKQAIANGFDFPVGKPDGAGYNIVAGCWWLQRDGACAPGPHPGEDWNDNGGGDSDLGDPVYAVANGVVVDSRDYTPKWGNIVLIKHTLPDGSEVWSQYAHLQTRMDPGIGHEVSKGDQIGTIGKGAGDIYWAHLHFEIRIRYLDADAWPSGWSDSQVLEYYTNPSTFINSHRQISGSDCVNYSYNGIVLFEHTDCSGSTRKFDYPISVNLNDFNDVTTSIYVPSGWSVRVFEHANAGGATRCINQTMWDLSQYTFDNSSLVMHDQISSVIVYNNSTCSSHPNPTSQVKLYSESNFNGSVVWQGSSDSNDPNADSYSMEVPTGWSVRVYDQDNYTGSERCWNTSVNNLQDHGWQLKIRSIKVYQDHDDCDPTPTSKVKLYSESNFNGSVVWEGASDSNDPNANSYSLEVPSGWSVWVYDQDNYTGSERCWSTSVNNLQDHGWQLKIRSIRVYQNDDACPKQHQVKLYSESNYNGSVVWQGSGDSNDPNANSYSLEVPSGWSVWVYDQDNYQGSDRCWNTSVNNLQDHGWHLKIQSIQVYSYDDCRDPPLPVKLYSQVNFGGSVVWQGSSDSNGPNADSYSLEMPEGWSVKVYDQDNYAGSERCWNTSVNNLQDHGWQLKIQSIRVYSRNACPPSAPASVQASDGAYTDRVRITWAVTAGASSYEVWRHTSNDSGAATRLASSIGGTSYDDHTADPEQIYYYWVKAENSNGFSGFSGSNPGYRALPPDAYISIDRVWTSTTCVVPLPEKTQFVPGETLYLVIRAENHHSSNVNTLWNWSVTHPNSSVENVHTDFAVNMSPGINTWCSDPYSAPGSEGSYSFTGKITWDSGSSQAQASTGFSVVQIAPPINVRASDGIYTDRVQVAWDTSEGATSYTVWRYASDNSGAATQIASSTGTSYDDTTVTPGQTYYYWIKAVNTSGSSEFSDSDPGYAEGNPPVAIVIPIQNDDLDGFEDPNFNISGDGNANNWVGTGTSVLTGWIFADSQIPQGATIQDAYVRFRGFGNGGDATAQIRGFDQDDADAFSADGANKPSTRPATTALVDWPNTWTFQWQWFQTPDLSNVVQEIVDRPGWASSNALGFSLGNPTGTGVNWATVDYAAGPYDGLGGGGHSVTLYITYTAESAGDPPPAPTSVSASDGAHTDRVRVTWNAAAGATSYEVWRHASDDSWAATRLASSIGGTSYDDSTADPGQVYYYWVKANNGNGASDFSGPDSGYRALTPDAYVTIDKVWTSTVCSLSTPETTQFAPGQSLYLVIRAHNHHNSNVDTLWSWSVTHPDSSIENVHTDFAVSMHPGVNIWCSAPYSAPDAQGSYGFTGKITWDSAAYQDQVSTGFSVVEVKPSSPTNVQASDGMYSDRVRVTWSTSFRAESYQVWRHTSADSSTATRIATSIVGPSYDDMGAISGQTYYYWIKAENTAGSSVFSASDSGYASFPVPSAPLGVSASELYADRVRVTWNASANATSYEVWRNTSDSTNSAIRIAPSLSGTSYDDASITSDQVYYYWVKAKNSSGVSGFSASATGRIESTEALIYLPLIVNNYRPGTSTNSPPNVPSNPLPVDGATDSDISVSLTWQGGDPNGDTVTYDVYFEASDSTPDNLLCNGISVTTCDPGTLIGQVYYAWYVVATDSYGATSTGPIWDFVTRPSVVLDQYQTGLGYGFGFDDTLIRWQEFMPSLSHLSSVDVHIQRVGDPGNVSVQVRDLGGNVLGQKVILQSEISLYGSWVSVGFSTPLSLSPGSKYRIYVRSDQDQVSVDNRYSWSGNTSSTYNPECTNDVSGSWPDYDYAFKTFGY